MYTKATSLPKLYIRNIIPGGMSIPRRRSWAYRGGAEWGYKGANFAEFRLGVIRMRPFAGL
jgi:hypothetical protein